MIGDHCITGLIIHSYMYFYMSVIIKAGPGVASPQKNKSYTAKISLTTVKPVLSGHSKIDKTKILLASGSLMKVKSFAEAFCNTFDLH